MPCEERGIVEFSALDIWTLFTRYGHVYLAASVSKYIQWQVYVPPAKEQSINFGSIGVSRPTERDACFLWRNGYMPGYMVVQDTYWTLPSHLRETKLDWSWVGKVPEPHPDAIGRVCIDCNERKPLTADFWHKNPDGKRGWHSVCKCCRNAADRKRYKAKKAA